MQKTNKNVDSAKSALLFTSLGHFANDGTVFFVPVIIDLLAVNYHVGTELITASLVLFYASMAISANILGSLIDKRNLHAEGMSMGIFALSLGLLLFSIAMGNFYIPFFMLLSSIITGFGASFYHPTGSSILQKYYGKDKLGRYLGINGSAGGIGRALYPALFFIIALMFQSHADAIILFGAIGIVFSITILFGLRKADGSFEKIKETNSQMKQRQGVQGKTINFGIILLAIIFLVRSLAFFGIISWIPEYISFERGIGASLSLGTILTLMFSGGIFGQLVFGKLVENHDKRMILVASTIISAVFMFMYLETTGFESLTSLLLFGFVNFSGFPIFMSMISDYVPRGATTSSNALVWNLGGTSGQAIGPLIVGLVIRSSYSNLPLIFEILLAVAIISALMGLLLPKPRKVSKVNMFG
ncbi:MAG: MFS transporter [Candidatus Marsarchaeota archaeon]|jgi:MFS family permease|nr:MFS transporter [Candidatus Marsarchaeota archaeon]